MSIFSTQPIFQTLPMAQPMVQTLSNTPLVFQTFPKTELIFQSLPNAELISRLLPKAEPISQSLWKAELISQPLLEAGPISQLFSEIKPMPLTSEMECPFAWKSESYSLNKLIQLFPSGAKLTISFTTTRSSKVLGYLPLIGTAMGIFRIYKGIQEYRFFNSIHLHSLTTRSFKWMARGVFESIPVLGGLICLIMDIISTILSKESSGILSNFEEETPCGYCHQCGYCNC
ncbi:hypothetical protein DB41_II00130 [Neochlamydia sp. TUME1]|uniref:hypothetical protein n=1 Tax=Neochlamydia sp. TUME1 TaxID=1478174 RepID=UPI00057EE160|nr:hypothetical protein [Neochlamydia sp. TUME1]KIC74628.1 hypothetical protein DB41_II00130 [Neochlamydia sp. TUME1]